MTSQSGMVSHLPAAACVSERDREYIQPQRRRSNRHPVARARPPARGAHRPAFSRHGGRRVLCSRRVYSRARAALPALPSRRSSMRDPPVHLEYRVTHTRWLVLRYPTPSMAQLAGMSTEQFEDYFYRVCTLDYARMAEAIEPLARRMRATDRVRLKGPGTDLRFSIKGVGVVPCEGRRNLPDGECFTAPVRDSANGTIRFNTPSLYLGTTYDRLSFRFAGGRIVEATGSPQKKLDEILGTDE